MAREAAFITRVVLSNYKSIRACSVPLGSPVFLVGPNGSGKSNFLDALRLVSESLTTSLDHALRERGGINEVRRRSAGHPTHFGVRIEWRLGQGRRGAYAFRVGSRAGGGYVVLREECRVWRDGAPMEEEAHFRVEEGTLAASSFDPGPPPVADRLYLVAASGLEAFRPFYDAVSHMGFYNINPDAIRDLQPPVAGEILKRDGANLAGVLAAMTRESRQARDLVVSYLGRVVPGIRDVETRPVGRRETLEFHQDVAGAHEPWKFPAECMSDGTLRALGVLVALFQSEGRVPFVGIEEPEIAVHPGAAGVLREAIQTASRKVQVVVTSHSPDLLDDRSITDDMVLAVTSRDGETTLGPLDGAGRRSIADGLHTAGDLLRRDEIEVDPGQVVTDPGQLELFQGPG